MKNNFAQEYAREEEIRAAYNTAKENGNEAGIEKAKADMRSLNEEIGAKGDAYAFVYRLTSTSTCMTRSATKQR